jgi:hypothetical protein
MVIFVTISSFLRLYGGKNVKCENGLRLEIAMASSGCISSDNNSNWTDLSNVSSWMYCMYCSFYVSIYWTCVPQKPGVMWTRFYGRNETRLSKLTKLTKLWRIPSSEMWCRVDLVWTDVSEERRFIQYLHNGTSQKTAFFIVTAVKTSDLT